MTSIPELTEVTSNNIKAMALQGNTLFVEFRQSPQGGAVWAYTPVTQQQYDDLKGAPSIGSHFHKWIRNNTAIKGVKVREPVAEPGDKA